MTDQISSPRATELAAPTVDIVSPQAIRTLFWRPRFLADEPAVDHLPLLFWLVEALAPTTTLDLGCRAGVAHLAFCQAVDKLGLEARCLAVGAWSEGLPDPLRRHSTEFYEDISQLVRAPAGLAPSLTGNGSVDLLHVDLAALAAEGASTNPEALLAAWLPHLADRGVVVLQATSVLDATGREALRRIAGLYPLVSFDHGAGLALVVTGTAADPQVIRLAALQPGMAGHGAVHQIFRRLGRALRLELQAEGQAPAAQQVVAPAVAIADPAELTALRAALEAEQQTTAALREEQAQMLAGFTRAAAEAQEDIARLRAEAGALQHVQAEAATQQAALLAAQAELDRLRAENAGLRQALDDERDRTNALEQQVNALLGSTSWKLTAPMRKVVLMTRREG